MLPNHCAALTPHPHPPHPNLVVFRFRTCFKTLFQLNQQSQFTNDCLISGHFTLRLRFELLDFPVTVIPDEDLTCILSHWVGQLNALYLINLVCVWAAKMNGCLVYWFYGVQVIHLPSVAVPLSWTWAEGAHRSDVQLPAVIIPASHSGHLRTWGSHKEPLARRSQSF